MTPEMGSVWAPTFDHAVKDPVEGGVEIGRGVRVCVFEGNYVGLEAVDASASAGGGGESVEAGEGEGEGENEGAKDATERDKDTAKLDSRDEDPSDESHWAAAKTLMDLTVFVEVDEDVARRRLVKRHVAAGIVANEAEAGRRADENDLVNGREIVRRRGDVDFVVRSVEDEGWA